MFCFAVVSCGPDDGVMPAESSGVGESTSADDTWLPDACSLEESPFEDPECLEGIRLACNEHVTENSCAATEPLSFGYLGAYRIGCAWAKVVVFSDDSACAVSDVFGRCESFIVTECGDYCAGNDMLTDVAAIPSRNEIIRLCGGPLGPWSAVGAENKYLSACAENVVPVSDPLCECAEAACSAG